MSKSALLLFIFLLISFYIKAQDIIYKTNGDTIRAKILEVGTNAVSFKKINYPDGPTFVEGKSEIRMIKYSNGEIQQFNQAEPVATYTVSANTGTVVSKDTSANTAVGQGTVGTPAQDVKNKIEKIDNKYTINGQKAGIKDVNRYLEKSKNPAIIVPLKAARMTKKAQKIVKITSIPTSIGGGFLSLVKVIDLYNDVQRGRTTSKSYTNAVFSLLGTFTLPITNKILRKKSDKMYDKLIDMYNLTN